MVVTFGIYGGGALTTLGDGGGVSALFPHPIPFRPSHCPWACYWPWSAARKEEGVLVPEYAVRRASLTYTVGEIGQTSRARGRIGLILRGNGHWHFAFRQTQNACVQKST